MAHSCSLAISSILPCDISLSFLPSPHSEAQHLGTISTHSNHSWNCRLCRRYHWYRHILDRFAVARSPRWKGGSNHDSWFILSWAIAREQFFERFEIVAIVDHPSEGSIVLRLQLRLECSHHRSFCLPRPESTIQKKPFISPD